MAQVRPLHQVSLKGMSSNSNNNSQVVKVKSEREVTQSVKKLNEGGSENGNKWSKSDEKVAGKVV